MVEPEKPFACTMPDCGMTFTNEDHLHVHTKKHDMVLQFGSEQKAAFVADQTPTPTRFIRNCEEVGLFQDLQSVNPFDEGFKRAMESKQGLLSLDTTPSSEDLHTPQMVFPLDPGDCVYTTNNHRNITISRSSSDESGAIKEFETTTISKLTNEVTTISRIVEKHDDTTKSDEKIGRNNVSYTNNVIKIQSNVEITKNIEKNDEKLNEITKPPVMSQKSIDFVVESLTSDFEKHEKPKKQDEYEVFIKLPSGQQIKLTSDEKEKETKEKKPPKDLLRKLLTEKVESKTNIPQIPVYNVTGGTLIPVSIVNANLIPKLPLKYDKKPVKRKVETGFSGKYTDKNTLNIVSAAKNTVNGGKNDVSAGKNAGGTGKNAEGTGKNAGSGSKSDFYKKTVLDSRCAASRRYRQRLKETWSKQAEELRQLKEQNDKLLAEKAVLQNIIVQHMKNCPNADDLLNMQMKHTTTIKD